MSTDKRTVCTESFRSRIRLLAGVWEPAVRPVRPFDEKRIAFLAELGKELRREPETALYTDVAAFGFWCRKSHLEGLKRSRPADGERLGKGLVFHIAPSNVPVNFAYSYVLGLLSGNANVVRVSSKNFPQVSVICRVLERLFAREEYRELREETSIVSYGHDREITDAYSAVCDMRVIWGGDGTIEAIRASKTESRCGEIAFADRYSIGVIRPSAVAAMDAEALRQLAVNFYNDTYLMDQNACSAPHMIFWLTDSPGEQACAADARERFWQAVFEAAGEYDLADVKVSGKYARLCNFLADWKGAPPRVRRYANRLYTAEIFELPEAIDELRGVFGLFFEYEAGSLAELADCITKKVQTAALCGVSREEMVEWIVSFHLQGIDRLTAFGQTLDMGIVWDGCDIIGSLSRLIG